MQNPKILNHKMHKMNQLTSINLINHEVYLLDEELIKNANLENKVNNLFKY
jgi:hypothetical protein